MLPLQSRKGIFPFQSREGIFPLQSRKGIFPLESRLCHGDFLNELLKMGGNSCYRRHLEFWVTC